MNAPGTDTWSDYNRRHLGAALAVVKARIAALIDAGATQDAVPGPAPDIDREPPALVSLSAIFGLSPFERDLLLLCAGVELDSGLAQLCARAQGAADRPHPTFGLALAALAEPHWSALVPDRPLRHWRLIELGAGPTLSAAALRIDERILHHLTGIDYLDERLLGWLEPVPAPQRLPAGQLRQAERVAAHWRAGQPPLVQLVGSPQAGVPQLAAFAAARTGLTLLRLVDAHELASVAERAAFARLLEREAILSDRALLLEHPAETVNAAVLELAQGLEVPVALYAPEPVDLPRRAAPRIHVETPGAAEQQRLWSAALGDRARRLNGDVERLVAQFDLGADQIAACAQLTADTGAAAEELWEACRVLARGGLERLAQRIRPGASRAQLVLPRAQHDTLTQIAAQVRQRTRVYQTWGFAAREGRGLGISALFSGASGTGKTMAAEVLAGELGLDLYRIDLSSVVSKYIGETEKNLRRVFDAAESSGAILLFDEADALFGKRSEVRDSHDRYANIEVSYLLQRMESYRGLAILTTNRMEALDTAFLRRIRFIVNFPFPDTDQRARIWRSIFPTQTPTRNLDVERLARLNVAGGNIRNIALSAAFLAADQDSPVTMTHLLRATRGEYGKLQRPLTADEIGDWS
jgi:hypothetical protein